MLGHVRVMTIVVSPLSRAFVRMLDIFAPEKEAVKDQSAYLDNNLVGSL